LEGLRLLFDGSARLEAGREEVQLETLDPRAVARQMVDLFRASAERNDLELHLTCRRI